MADINKTAAEVTAILMTVDNATNGGVNTLVTSANIDDIPSNKIEKPSAEGSNGQVLTTNGAGGVSWTDKLNSTELTEAVSDWLDEHVDPTGAAVIVDSTLTISGAAADAKVTGDELGTLRSALFMYTKNVDAAALFNGENSLCGFKQIELSSDGDSIEFKVKTSITRQSTTFYAFAARGSGKNNVAIAIATNKISVRASDNTWVCDKNVDADTKYRVIKIEYSNGNVITKVNGSVINTYTGQKTLIIDWIGYNTTYGYWAGEVEYIKINSNKYSILQMPGYVGSNITYTLPNGLLTPEQSELLNNASDPKYTVIPSNNAVNIYFHLFGNKYGNILIKHTENHNDANYTDYWRVEACHVATSSDGINFTDTSDLMLVGAENEMAILFNGFDDHIGGWHGDERIDLDNDCYVAFIADGVEYTASELLAKGSFKCNEFNYREVSQLFAPYSYNTNHLPVAKHVKTSAISHKGFTTTNLVMMDLTDFNQDTLKIVSAYTGMFCIATPFSMKVVSDTGTVYTASHPSTTAVLVDRPNVFERKIKTFNDTNSCIVDSKLINTNISGFVDPPINITIMDRENDNKYYSYLPKNINVIDGDYFAVESSISWSMAQ